jgi:methyl-accepting chemotaxis protein
VQNQSNNTSTEELRELIVEENTPVRFGEAGYFFIYDYEGNTISLPPDRDVEGTNRWDLKDAQGTYLSNKSQENSI